MRAHSRALLTLAVLALSQAAVEAQTPTTRADDARAMREAKAAEATPFAPGTVERVLDFIEYNATLHRLLMPADGFGVRLGGIDGGSPLAFGPAWRATRHDGGLRLSASGAASWNGDRGATAGLSLPHLGTHRLRAEVGVGATHLAGERFFGLGLDAARADETAYRLEQHRVHATLVTEAGAGLTVTGGAALLHASAGDGRRRRLPAIGARFSPDEVPGLADPATWRVLSIAAALERRDLPGNPRAGGRYEVAVARYSGGQANRYAFTRIDTLVEQHLSAWRRQRLLTLRAVTSTSLTGEGRDVPFFLQPSLGGSRLLRGFVTDRFRDRQLLAVQAEYGFDLLPFVSAVAFYEAGAVTPRWRDLSLRDLRRDYGLGFRFGGARSVALRTDVAFGSGEGTRLSMRFSHAF